MKIEFENECYKLSFPISKKIKIDNSFLWLIFEINNNIINEKKIENITENSFTIYILLKHFFKEFGTKIKYMYFDVKHDLINKKIHFQTKSPLLNNTNELLNLDIMIKYENTLEQNNLLITIQNNDIPEDLGLENFISKIIIKIFKNLKEYLESQLC